MPFLGSSRASSAFLFLFTAKRHIAPDTGQHHCPLLVVLGRRGGVTRGTDCWTLAMRQSPQGDMLWALLGWLCLRIAPWPPRALLLDIHIILFEHSRRERCLIQWVMPLYCLCPSHQRVSSKSSTQLLFPRHLRWELLALAIASDYSTHPRRNLQHNTIHVARRCFLRTLVS